MLLYSSIIGKLRTGPLSLADLQSATQVSLPTLRKAVQELTDSHWIRIVGQAEANGGRPAMLFGLDDTYFTLLGVHLQLPGMRMILTDLTGQVLHEIELFQQMQPTPDAVVQAVLDYALSMKATFANRVILGVGIATPGFTDPETGDILTIGRVAGWQNFPICQRIRTALNLPVQIANDVDCMAFAEFHHTGKSFTRNLAYFGFDEGIKVSMFLNGELYKGSFGNAGLIVSRFLRITDDTLSIDDQNRMMTLSGLNLLFEAKVAQQPATEQQHYADLLHTGNRQRMEMILSGAYSDLPVCRQIVAMLNDVLAAVIANMIYVIQPDHIVIGGLLSALSDTLFTRLSASIRELLPALFSNYVQIERSRLTSSNVAAQGANHHFFDDYLTASSPSLILTPANG